MNTALEQSIENFCRIYQNNMEQILRERLPADTAEDLCEELNDEFRLFRQSLFNRLHEE